MMIKNTLFALALSVVAAASPAYAGLTDLGKSQGWVFSANFDTGLCMASAAYKGGDIILIALTSEGFSMSFTSDDVQRLQVGKEYNIKVRTSSGGSGRLWGEAVTSNQIIIQGLTAQTVYHLAKAKTLHIDSFGAYTLKGSSNAIKRLTECYSAIN